MKFYVITIALDHEQEHVLIIHKLRGPSDVKNKINFPGGHVEPGESSINAAKRELQEETGLNLPMDDFFQIARAGDDENFQIDVYAVNTSHDILCTAVSATDEKIEMVNVNELKEDMTKHKSKYAPDLEAILNMAIRNSYSNSIEP